MQTRFPQIGQPLTRRTLSGLRTRKTAADISGA